MITTLWTIVWTLVALNVVAWISVLCFETLLDIANIKNADLEIIDDTDTISVDTDSATLPQNNDNSNHNRRGYCGPLPVF